MTLDEKKERFKKGLLALVEETGLVIFSDCCCCGGMKIEEADKWNTEWFHEELKQC